ncbi:MAG: hypothetical protein HY755_03075 [Nitrospirae bacterium]|nr:hypothetical protein [Nitrospirota bacterium]
MKTITVETLYKKVIELQRDVVQIKKSLLEEPELRAEFIQRMRDIDLEKSVMVKDFGKRYGLK